MTTIDSIAKCKRNLEIVRTPCIVGAPQLPSPAFDRAFLSSNSEFESLSPVWTLHCAKSFDWDTARMNTLERTDVELRVDWSIHINIYIYRHERSVFWYVCMSLCMHACMYVCTYVMYVCIYCMHVCNAMQCNAM